MAIFYDPPKEPSIGSFTDSQENVLHIVTNETFDSKDTDEPNLTTQKASFKAVKIDSFS